MTEEFGIPLGENVPSIDTIDIFDKAVKLEELLIENRGVLIDFSRGAW